MHRHFLFFCSYSYAIPILRPLEGEIKRRGDDVAWFLEDTCNDELLNQHDKRLTTKKEVKEWNPVAVFAPGDYVYYFFPGIKVMLFHGYPINKRSDTKDVHFRIRGWYDIYCTQGPSSTKTFLELEKKYGSFRIYETGWAKTDDIIKAKTDEGNNREKNNPTIFVTTTFTSHITQLRNILPTIKKLADKYDWNWIITMHPKLDDQSLKEELKEFERSRNNVTFHPAPLTPSEMSQTDIMLCDASSIILEYMILDKPVVTVCNTKPGPHLLNVRDPEEIEEAIKIAITRPQKLMDAIKDYVALHEAHTDGHNCQRIMDAVDDFIKNHKGKIKRKPLNLFRKIKLRIKLLNHSQS